MTSRSRPEIGSAADADVPLVNEGNTPQGPTREWQGLSTAERKVLWNLTKKPSEYAELIEAKLKEKNHE